MSPDGAKGHRLPVDDADSVVRVELAPAAEWPEPSIPADLKAALDDAPDLDDAWQDITPMARWEWVRRLLGLG